MTQGRTRDADRGTRRGERDDEEEEYLEPLSAAEAAREGLRLIDALTNREAQGVVSLEPTDEGWRVGVEVVEDRRIPSSTDLLGLYEIDLDVDGELLGYRRVRRYQRGKGEVG
ncbi:gas vesicle protein GvpO [Micromonospora okii]|uniref:gas vesicle protein GvpO n=1 Tax=Micromonospora okii TaxID=1182970 RepID=UPI001E503510|nr:gas vesicle protein [Micromonospora okii]